MRSIGVWSVCAAVVVCTAGLSLAEGEQRIGFIDMRRVMTQSKGGRAAAYSFESTYATKKETYDKKRQEVKDLQTQASASQAKPGDRASAQEKLLAATKDLKRFRQDLIDELRAKDKDLASSVTKTVDEIAAKVGKEQGFSAVIQMGTQVIYADKSYDITDEVIKRYDELYSKK